MASKKPTVLCVDDDHHLLAGLELTLRGRFAVRTATSGRSALAQLGDGRKVDVIVADLSMPEMNGPQFLAQAQAVAPDAVRLLLTGQATVGGTTAAVNQGGIHRILMKPVPPEELVAAVEAAVEHGRQRAAAGERLKARSEEAFRKLVEAERRAAMGTLAGAVGGELSNVVAAFDMALEQVAEAMDRQAPPGAEEVAVLRRVREHVAQHARTLRDLAAPVRDQPEVCEFAEAVESTVAMLRFSGLLRHVRVHVGLPDGPVYVPLSRARVEQVVINLVKNAVEAITEVVGRHAHVFLEVVREPDGRTATLTVEDNGNGVPEPLRQTLFEPYVTSRPRHQAGLGLYVVRLIVDSRQGTAGFATREGRGTTFTERLPRVTPATPVS